MMTQPEPVLEELADIIASASCWSVQALEGGRFRLFFEAVETVAEGDAAGLSAALDRDMGRAMARGLSWAGVLAYEAAAAFEPGLPRLRAGDGALARWGLFGRTMDLDQHSLVRLADLVADRLGIPQDDRSPVLGKAVPDWDQERYSEAFARVRECLEAGTSYQMNLTFSSFAPLGLPPVTASADPDGVSLSGFPWWAFMLWTRLLQGGQGRHAAWWYSAPVTPHEQGVWIASLSPELLFRKKGQDLECRPMKGTAPRSPDPETDRALARELGESPKNQAENLMIVDMIRNDLGRIALAGSVAVARLFQVETYPTLHQMTSTVTARTTAGPGAVLGALFPCASITGAPRISTMVKLAELEARPRGFYTGSAGWVSPDGDACFNVLIRTLLPGRPGHRELRLDSGGGVVWDSSPQDEYREALLKLAFAEGAGTGFDLVESLRLFRGGQDIAPAPDGRPELPLSAIPGTSWSWFLLEEHLDRLQASSRRLGRSMDRNAVKARLESWARESAADQVDEALPDLKVRLVLGADGTIMIESSALDRGFNATEALACALAPWPLECSDVERLCLGHKTSDRRIYQHLARPGAEQTISWDSRGRLLESSTCNLVLRMGGRWVTPLAGPLMLEGTYRRCLIESGRIHEEDLDLAALFRADGVWLVNSVRGWIPAALQAGGFRGV